MNVTKVSPAFEEENVRPKSVEQGNASLSLSAYKQPNSADLRYENFQWFKKTSSSSDLQRLNPLGMKKAPPQSPHRNRNLMNQYLQQQKYHKASAIKFSVHASLR